MKRFLKSHHNYYISLCTMLLICMGLFVLNAHQPPVQVLILVMSAVLYVIWGVAHHFIHHDISAKIMVEYVLIAAMVMALALLVIN